ncbi:hypothetical protein COCC4DRAFT_73001 [Bipolaris maydis ATCC 48331]|uniref:Methyltransferase small domain-containing protein n=2 Tax=Cochliobolus heterostrophus TaxID=5016 RepID=M2TZ80_COCH5|nr:uncharacterized protein COCC4DRAFT_73001 [Bipolaris maydis ATCC 48331]EMD87151.1 hypothetical protein COCHEDRAFT_1185658 [Bipolaris maydis C5]KAH7559657.1 hypothetical protein BM1_03291 [Bipolaris maydis]ENI03856.1 hypothetical protein COCC4DRAFT_73001 [Bipolaris maydis ATCC 48331]KAJ5021539.1 hypothetical protein J3E73DRAFT_427233 [Bipolaris maydis]KAJ5055822.1 hypothetical protein J3E74DRAFT_478337 [Bipolaris maydis]
MSCSLTGSCLPPSSSLPPARLLVSLPEVQITSALKHLRALYCPVRLPTVISTPVSKRDQQSITSPPAPVDSGYASQDEDEDDQETSFEELTAALRADPFERTFTTQWLNSLLARSEEMNMDEEARERIVDDAAFILSSLFEFSNSDEDEALTRDFSFAMPSGEAIQVTLNDAPLSSTDHTAVGLQSWGASIVLSSMMCSNPKRFGLDPLDLAPAPKITELGAGTGLVSLVLAKLLPTINIPGGDIAATDYHPAVLENCELNIKTNFPSSCTDALPPVSTALLDWAQPPQALKATSNLLIASDVVYAPEHAAWLRDCAAHMLTPDGNFWLMVTVRKTGKFEGIPDTVESAFVPEKCPKNTSGMIFRILEKEFVEKRRGIGRGDESGYNLYRIGWA